MASPRPYLTQWSFSRWSLYDQCPFKCYCRHVLGMPDPAGPQAERGTILHQVAQDYIEGKREELTPEFDKLKSRYAELRAVNALCELEWGFKRDWTPCTFNDPEVWLRVKTDAIYSPRPGWLWIGDHKTGKIYEDKHALQVDLYATSGFILHPNADDIKTVLLYVEKGKTKVDLFQRANLESMISAWERRVTPMFNDDIYPMKPNEYCYNCNRRKEVGGPCEF